MVEHTSDLARTVLLRELGPVSEEQIANAVIAQVCLHRQKAAAGVEGNLRKRPVVPADAAPGNVLVPVG